MKEILYVAVAGLLALSLTACKLDLRQMPNSQPPAQDEAPASE